MRRKRFSDADRIDYSAAGIYEYYASKEELIYFVLMFSSFLMCSERCSAMELCCATGGIA